MTKNTNFVGARLEKELKQRFDEHVQDSGKTPTEVVREAISHYLNFTPSKITVNSNWKTDLEKRVKSLEEKLAEPVQTGLFGDNTKSDNKPAIKEIENQNIDRGGWLTTREAHAQYASKLAYSTFRKFSAEQLLIRFRLESDPSRKKVKDRKWLRLAKSGH